MGPRNMGPYDPPPWSERLKAITAGLLFLACIIGSMITHDKQNLASLAIASVFYLMTAMSFPARAMDKHGVGEDEETRDKNKDK